MSAAPIVSLDIRQLGTPWAILKVGQALRGLRPGQVLEVLGTDPLLRRDLPPVVAAGGGKLFALEEHQGLLRFSFILPGGENPTAKRKS